MNQSKRREFVNAIMDKHPKIEEKFFDLLNLVENTSGQYKRADDVEEKVINELQTLGREFLECWAKCEEERAFNEVMQTHPDATMHSKKSSITRQPMDE